MSPSATASIHRISTVGHPCGFLCVSVCSFPPVLSVPLLGVAAGFGVLDVEEEVAALPLLVATVLLRCGGVAIGGPFLSDDCEFAPAVGCDDEGEGAATGGDTVLVGPVFGDLGEAGGDEDGSPFLLFDVEVVVVAGNE